MIKLKNISVNVPNKQIIKKISLEFHEKTHYLILGPNGCGKSTLMKSLCSLISYEGKIIKDDEVIYVPQNLDYYFLTATVFEEIRISKNGNKTFEVIDDILEKFNLKHLSNSMPSKLSGGEKVRLAIAIATLNNPKYIIFDETIGMNDYKNQKILEEYIEKLKKTATILEITHDIKRIDVADQLLVMNNGEVLTFGAKDEILKNKEVQKLLLLDEDLIFNATSQKYLKAENYVRN